MQTKQVSAKETNHLASELLKDYNIAAKDLTASDINNIINLLFVLRRTRREMSHDLKF